jgi:pantothenate kinase-related protein Tda10
LVVDQAEAAMRADGRSGMTDEQVGTNILSIKCSIRSKMKVWLFNNPNSQMHTYLLTMVILHLVNKCSYISSAKFQVADFVSIYMPAYNAYLPALYKKGPRGASHEHMLRLQIDEDRNPIG